MSTILKIGDIDAFEGKVIECVATKGNICTCENCFFRSNCHSFNSPPEKFECMSKDRLDGKYVYFKEILK